MTTYGDRRSYRLFARDTFGAEVTRYQEAERRLLRRLVRGQRSLVEIGCGKAEHLHWARSKGLDYTGVDPCRLYLDEATKRCGPEFGGKCRLVVGGIEQTDLWLRYTTEGATLVLVPFNCLGNALDPIQALHCLSLTPATLVVSCFHDHPRATRVRRQYYGRAGYAAASHRIPLGVRFVCGGRLATIGFRPGCLKSVLGSCGRRAFVIPLGDVGFAIVVPSRASIDRRRG